MLFTNEELKVIERIARKENCNIIDVKYELESVKAYYNVGAGELNLCDIRFDYDNTIESYRVDVYAFLGSMLREIKNVVRKVNKATAKCVRKRITRDIINGKVDKYVLVNNKYYNYHAAYGSEFGSTIYVSDN
jgi:hypothetical protein